MINNVANSFLNTKGNMKSRMNQIEKKEEEQIKFITKKEQMTLLISY